MTLVKEHRPRSGEYWHARRHKWETLYKQAAFWTEFETSNFDPERVIAIVRRMGLPGRGAMSDETFQREIFLRVNRFVIEELLEDKHKEVKNFK